MTAEILISAAISLALTGVSALLQPSRNEKVQQGKIDNFTEPRGSYGDIISDVWGLGRVSGILIFGTFPPEEVVTTETQTQGKGPRNSTTTETYTYFGNFAFLLCTKSTEVKEIRFNSKLVYKDGATDPIISSKGGSIRVYNGSETQTVDSLLSAELGDAALAYRGRTYIVCEGIPLEEFGNSYPQCSAIVRNGSPKLSEVISDICLQSSDLVSDDIEVSELTSIDVRGFQTNSEGTIAEKLQALQKIHFFDLIDTGSKLRFQTQFRSTASAFIPVDLMGAHEENSERPRPWRESRPDLTQLPSRVEVKFLDVDRNLEPNVIQSVIFPDADHTRVESIDFTGALSTSEAKAIADRTLWRIWTSARTQEFSLPPRYANLEAGDVIEVELYGSESQQLQIESLSYGANHLLQIKTKAYNPLIYGWSETNSAPDDPDNPSLLPLPPTPPRDTTLPIVSPTTLRVLDIPLAYPTDTPGIYAFADGDANWRNATLYVSLDLGVTYEFAGTFITRSTFGTAQTIFNGTAVDIRVPFHASLASLSTALFLEGKNRALLGNEILDFQNATLTGNIGSDRIYQLTAPFTRGISGTPQAHAANENFYLLSGYKLNLPAQRSDIGKTFYFKAVSPGQTLSDVTPVTLLFQGKAFQVVIDDFSPRQGAIGVTVTITGLGFTGATAVSFNNVPAQFTVVSDTTLTAVVAAGTTTGKIRITAPLGVGVSAVDFTIVADGSMLSIQDEGNLVGARPTLNFIGSVVTATDNPGSDRVDVTVSPPTIQDEGNLVGARPTLNFIGPNISATDNPGSNRVDVTLNKEDRIFGEIERPTVKEYTLEYFVSRPYTIKNLVIGTSSGTATVSIQINGVNVSGVDNIAVSSTRLNLSAGTNLAVLGSIITLRVISVNNAVDLKFNLIYDYA